MNIKKIFKAETFVTIVIIALSLFLYMVFKVDGNFQKLVSTIGFLFLMPVLYIKLILKKSLGDFGIKIGDWKKGIIYSVICMFVLAIIFYFLFTKFNFIEKYYLPTSVIVNFKSFILRELLIVGFFIALYEFFFRGFVMFYFLDKFKSVYYSNLLQVIIFYLFLVSVGTFDWARAPYILLAPLAGIVAQKSQSILYSFIFSWIAFLIIDTVFIKIIIKTALLQQ